MLWGHITFTCRHSLLTLKTLSYGNGKTRYSQHRQIIVSISVEEVTNVTLTANVELFFIFFLLLLVFSLRLYNTIKSKMIKKSNVNFILFFMEQYQSTGLWYLDQGVAFALWDGSGEYLVSSFFQ